MSVFSFGHEVRDARISLGLSIRDLADKVGRSPTYIHQLETKATSSVPSEEFVRGLCDTLGLNFYRSMFKIGRVPEFMIFWLLDDFDCFQFLADKISGESE